MYIIQILNFQNLICLMYFMQLMYVLFVNKIYTFKVKLQLYVQGPTVTCTFIFPILFIVLGNLTQVSTRKRANTKFSKSFFFLNLMYVHTLHTQFYIRAYLTFPRYTYTLSTVHKLYLSRVDPCTCN